MPVLPNFMEQMLFFRLNQAPGPVMDIFSAVSFRIVLAAVRLGVFDLLAVGPASPAEAAAQLKADESGLAHLLAALEAFGYVRREGERYANTPMASKWMVRSSPNSVAAGFEYWGATLPTLWEQLEEALCSGAPPTPLYPWLESRPEISQVFQEWLVAIARQAAGEILGKLKLSPDTRRMLDVGGGHGTYSLELCRRVPGLKATVFDSPQALQAARAQIAAAGMEPFVTLQEGDFLQDDLGRGYDVALLFNIVHGLSPEQNQALLAKAAGALRPGGTVAIVEQVASTAPGPASLAAVRVLEMSFFHLLGGQVYPHEVIRGWLQQAGFHTIRRKNLLMAPGSCLITAKT